MFAEEPRMEAVHGLCCDALAAHAKDERKEKRLDRDELDEPDRPKYSLPCD